MSSFKNNENSLTIYNLLYPIIKEGESVSVSKLSSFIDFFNYVPYRTKKDKNNSKELYYVMTSNQHGEATYDSNGQNTQTTMASQSEIDNESKHFKKLLGIIWSKIYERFPNINHAFRFFDCDYNQSVSFNEFVQGLEYLRIKFSYEDIKKIFKYMDTNGDGHIGYDEFC